MMSLTGSSLPSCLRDNDVVKARQREESVVMQSSGVIRTTLLFYLQNASSRLLRPYFLDLLGLFFQFRALFPFLLF